jgi:galactonate dehydratase
MFHSTSQRRERLANAISARAAAPGLARADQGLEVKDLGVYPLREPVSGRRYTVIRIQTQSGLTGCGECGPVSVDDLARTKPVVLGKAATAYEIVRRQLEAVPNLQAAVNIALLDVVGKWSKVPLFQVLGGPTRNKVRAITSLEGHSVDSLNGSMKRAQEAGYRAFLVLVPPAAALNQGQAFVHAVQKQMESLRTAGGEGIDFALSGEGSLSVGDASSVASALERFHLLWFDEPCRLFNLGAVRKIGAESVTPLGFGRHLHHGGDFQDLLREEVADVLRPSLSLNGITHIRKTAALAETYYVAVAPYHDGGPVGTAAALHLAASLPNFFIQQIPLPQAEADRNMRAEITGTSVEVVKEGYAALPVGVGLGITVREEALEKYKERAL